jgi:hypothetical protein
MPMHAWEKSVTQQFDHVLVSFATPDEHSGTHAILRRVSNGYSMGDVLRRQAQRSRDAARSQIFHPNQANLDYGMATLHVNF